MKIDLVLFNSSDCEIGRYAVPQDEFGFPLTLAAVAQDVELRSALLDMQPGDTLKMVERESD